MPTSRLSQNSRLLPLSCLLLIAVAMGTTPARCDEVVFAGGWKQNAMATAIFEINGTEARNNPIRRQLEKPFSGDELYVRYRIRYSADSIDTPDDDEGEFVVLWLDANEGNDGATHSGGVPNVGIHVAGSENRFMVRYESRKEKYAAELVGDQEFLVVARLWKSRRGESQPFDQLNLWVDPDPESELKPDASVESPKSVSQINWIGFSTGGKTELEDQIFVRDIQLATDWHRILGLPAPVPSVEEEKVVKRTIEFDEHVFPILKSKCFSCHEGADAEIRLDVHDEVLNLVSPGSAEDSHLFSLVSSREMPPEDEPLLDADQIKTIRTWIDEGVAWNPDRLPPPTPQTDHWAFQPIVRPEIPSVRREHWVQTPVDAFIARRQEDLGVTPLPPAPAHILARRMSLDLLGLPATDQERSVDELLSHPAYGERWGRHWLDVARWAESNGHQHNRFRPHAWRYRDWVIDAFNQDMPFDEFLTSQVAGDELVDGSTDSDGHLVATGFLSAARYSGNELDKRIQRNDILVDVVNTTANAMLGLTFECAQCHTHKFDPISLRDYYRLQAFFAKGQPCNVSLLHHDAQAAEWVNERWEIFDRTYNRLVTIRRRKGEPNPELVLPKTVESKIGGVEKQRYDALKKKIAELDQTWGYYAPISLKDTQSHSNVNANDTRANARTVTPHEMRWPLPRNPATWADVKTNMLLRGDINARGPEVQPGWPRVFGATDDLGDFPRTALANWMTGKQNPLTARVWVNRIWYWHFGKGIVETVGDFGTKGARPSHPELLDYLASELMNNGWSTHHIHRLILHSATYQQSSGLVDPASSDDSIHQNTTIDPENKTYWRWKPRRLEAESIRDSMLAVSGQLERKMGGASDPVASESKRRSVYLRQHRARFPDQQMLFDSADGVVSCSRRRISTNALQPLWLMNSQFAQRAAADLAERAETAELAFEICLGRSPSPSELQEIQAHVNDHGLTSLCVVLLNCSEFLYIP